MKLAHGEAVMILFEHLSYKSVTEMNRRGSAYRNVEVLLRQKTGGTECPQDVGMHLPTGLSASGPSANTSLRKCVPVFPMRLRPLFS